MKKLSQELIEMIDLGEKYTIEFKEAKDKLPKSLFETICSFLNRNGGHIFLGIDDNKNIVGVNPDSVKQMKKDFANMCNNPEKIEPTVYLNIDEFEYQDKVILHIYVPEGSSIHSSVKKIYDRNQDGDYEVKTTNQIATIARRKDATFTENTVFRFVTVDDLNKETIDKVRKLANSNFRMNHSTGEHPWMDMSDLEMLKSMDLFGIDETTGQEGLTLAAIVLFGTDELIADKLPYYRTDAIYRVKDLDRYDDRDDIRTNLIESYYRLMAFCDKHLDDRFYLENGIQRKDLRNLICREIVANILMHREFMGTYVARFIIEKDFIKTENSCKAFNFGKIDLNNVRPRPKNPKIAKIFHEIGWADELGSGVRNLVKYTKIYSGGVPSFNEEDVFTTIVPINYKENENGQKVDGKVDTKVDTKVDGKLTKNQQEILEILKQNPYIVREAISQKVGISVTSVSNNLKKLTEKGYIERVGSDKGGYWEILK